MWNACNGCVFVSVLSPTSRHNLLRQSSIQSNQPTFSSYRGTNCVSADCDVTQRRYDVTEMAPTRSCVGADGRCDIVNTRLRGSSSNGAEKRASRQDNRLKIKKQDDDNVDVEFDEDVERQQEARQADDFIGGRNWRSNMMRVWGRR